MSVCVCMELFFIGFTKMLQLHYSTLSLKNIFSLFDSVDNGNLLYFSINRFFLHWPSELHANIFRSYVAYWHFNVQYIFCTCFFTLKMLTLTLLCACRSLVLTISRGVLRAARRMEKPRGGG